MAVLFLIYIYNTLNYDCKGFCLKNRSFVDKMPCKAAWGAHWGCDERWCCDNNKGRHLILATKKKKDSLITWNYEWMKKYNKNDVFWNDL